MEIRIIEGDMSVTFCLFGKEALEEFEEAMAELDS